MNILKNWPIGLICVFFFVALTWIYVEARQQVKQSNPNHEQILLRELGALREAYEHEVLRGKKNEKYQSMGMMALASGNSDALQLKEKDREITILKQQLERIKNKASLAPPLSFSETRGRSGFEYLLSHRTDRQIGQSLAHELAENGPVEWAESPQMAVSNWTGQDENGRTPWLRAIAAGQMPMVKWLSEKLTKFNEVDGEGNGPLHLAISGGEEVLKFLLTKNLDKEAKNQLGQTPLHCAILQGKSEMLKMLMASGADVEAVDVEQKRPVHYAAMVGDAAMLKLLLPQIKNTKPVDQFGYTPFLLAVRSGKTLASDVLLSDYGDINQEDVYGWVPLFYAIIAGDEAMVQWLARHGAVITARDRYGRSAMHFGVKSGKTSMLELLFRLGLVVQVVDQSGLSPLHWAVLYGTDEMVQLLVSCGADIRAVDFEGNSVKAWVEQLRRESLYKTFGIVPGTFEVTP
jgi:ankyrin repeat protein